MLRTNIKSYVIGLFHSNLPQSKITRISFSDLNNNVLVLVSKTLAYKRMLFICMYST